jgi:hypothetical protein
MLCCMFATSACVVRAIAFFGCSCPAVFEDSWHIVGGWYSLLTAALDVAACVPHLRARALLESLESPHVLPLQ